MADPLSYSYSLFLFDCVFVFLVCLGLLFFLIKQTTKQFQHFFSFSKLDFSPNSVILLTEISFGKSQGCCFRLKAGCW